MAKNGQLLNKSDSSSLYPRLENGGQKFVLFRRLRRLFPPTRGRGSSSGPSCLILLESSRVEENQNQAFDLIDLIDPRSCCQALVNNNLLNTFNVIVKMHDSRNIQFQDCFLSPSCKMAQFGDGTSAESQLKSPMCSQLLMLLSRPASEKSWSAPGYSQL